MNEYIHIDSSKEMKVILSAKTMPLLYILSSILVFSIPGCSGFNYLVASFMSTDSFIESRENHYVRYKGSNEKYSNQVAKMAPQLISRVETKLGIQFLSIPVIYICDTEKCTKNYTGLDYVPRAASNNKGIFISPKLIGKIEETEYLLPHEITHALLTENINSIFKSKPPAWFDEGLATFVADGAGAEEISKKQAIDSIINGKYFIPNDNGKLFSPMYGDNWGLKPHMFYRQSMLFVEYLNDIDPEKFQLFVREVFTGKKKFSELFLHYYGSAPSIVWREYRYALKKLNIVTTPK